MVSTAVPGAEKKCADAPWGVVANDVDQGRAYTLVNRLKTLDLPTWLVTKHPAQSFPLLYLQDHFPRSRSPKDLVALRGYLAHVG